MVAHGGSSAWPRRARRPYTVYIAVEAAIVVAAIMMPRLPAGILLRGVVVLVGTVAFVIGVLWRRPRPAAAWRLLVIGAAIEGSLTVLVITAYGPNGPPDIDIGEKPTALILNGVGVVAIASGLFLLSRVSPYGGIADMLDGVIVAVGGFLLVWTFLVEPRLGPGGLSVPSAVVYPAGTLVVFALAAKLALSGALRDAAVRLLLLAMLLRLIASVLAQLPAISDEYIHTTELGTEYAWAGYGLVLGAVGVHPGLTMPRQRQRPSSGGLSVGRLALYIGLALIAPLSWMVELVRNSGAIAAYPLGFGVPAVSSALLLVVLVVRLGLISRVLQRRVDELGGRSVELSAAVTDLRQLQQELTFRVTHDSLTGLSSREVLIERLGPVSRQTDESVGYALILLDLDGFKDVNDSMGHPAGDALLVEVGRRIRQTAPPEATPARLGGDEFAVLLERVKPDAARRYARTTLAAVGRPYSIVGRQLVLSASVGLLIIEPRQPRPTPSDMLRDVDLALYAAKNAGKNRMVTFEPGLRLNRPATTTAAPDGTGSGS